MKRRIQFSLLVLFGVTALFQTGLSQTPPVIDITIGKQTLRFTESNIQKAKPRIVPQPQPREVTDKKPGTVAKAANQPCEDVKKLAKEYHLNEATAPNPHLAFDKKEISQWCRKNLSEIDLRYEFAARQLVLEAAKEQRVSIRDQDMLSEAVQGIIAKMREENPKSTTAVQTSNPEIRQAPPGPPANQPPDVSCEICKSKNSQGMLEKAWTALNASQGGMDKDNFETALACTKCAIGRWQSQADAQQAKRQQTGECHTTPSASQRDAYFGSYWALADIGTAWFIRGQSLSRQQRWQEAREAYKMVIDKYSCAYTWDPQGWFWRTADGAQEQYNEIQNK